MTLFVPQMESRVSGNVGGTVTFIDALTQNGTTRLLVQSQPIELPTFSVIAQGVAGADNVIRSNFVLYNGTSNKLRICHFAMRNASTASGAVIGTYNMVRIATGTTPTGTALSVVSFDSGDTLPSGIVAFSVPTITGGTSQTWDRQRLIGDEISANASENEGVSNAIQQSLGFSIAEKQAEFAKLPTLNNGEGLSIVQQAGINLANVLIDYFCVFTVSAS
jgi:hypothetical protein